MEHEKEIDFAYIGIAPCGCCVAATADKPRYREAVAETLRDYILNGYTIERIPCSEVGSRLTFCICGAKPE